MSQVRFETPAHQNLLPIATSPIDHSAPLLLFIVLSLPSSHSWLTPPWPGGHWEPMVWKERLNPLFFHYNPVPHPSLVHWSFIQIGFFILAHSRLLKVSLAPLVNITAHFLSRWEVLPMHVSTSIGHGAMHDTLLLAHCLYLNIYLLLCDGKVLDGACKHHCTCLFSHIFYSHSDLAGFSAWDRVPKAYSGTHVD